MLHISSSASGRSDPVPQRHLVGHLKGLRCSGLSGGPPGRPSSLAHLSVQHVQPAVGHGSHGIIAFTQAGAGKELLEDLCLEQLDQLQLATTLQDSQAETAAAQPSPTAAVS